MRPIRLALSAFALLALGLPAAAQSADPEKERQEAEALKAATALCDARMSAPLDPLAVAPPVYSLEMKGLATFDAAVFGEAVDACTQAALADPDNARLRYQYLRALFYNPKPGGAPAWTAKAIDSFAAAGHVDAAFVSWQALDRDGPTEAAAPQALAYLRKAAEAGHLEAMHWLSEMLSRRHARYPYAPREAVEWATRLAAGAPPVAPDGASYVDRLRADAAYDAAVIALQQDGFSDEERRSAFAVVKTIFETSGQALWPYANALRFGSGVTKDLAAARAVLEKATWPGVEQVALAEMLLAGEGGPVDRPRALQILKNDRLRFVPGRGRLLADIYRGPDYPGPQPRAALAAIEGDVRDGRAAIAMAALMTETKLASPRAKDLSETLAKLAAGGAREAAYSLARLTFVGHGDFRDAAPARRALAPFAAQGDLEAKVMLAELHCGNLDSSSGQAQIVQDQLSADAIREIVEQGVAAGNARAVALKGRLQRRGAFYPQDDQAATRALVRAAELGDVHAMILAGKAYDDGLGVQKDRRERLRWWREAARRGSLEARESLASAFVFDSFDKLMTLREGVTEPIILWANGLGFRYGSTMAVMSESALSSTFRGGRISDAPAAAIAAAVLEGVKLAPAALEDQKLVALGRALPQEVKVEIERALGKAGYFQGRPEGYFGPDVRAAMTAFVEKAPRPEAKPEPKPEAKAPPSAAPQTGLVPNEILDKARERAFQMAINAKTDGQRAAALKLVAQLARYGDMAARWALVRNYHQSRLVRAATTPEELTRYALDVLVSKPKGAEKAEFEFIFDVTRLFQDRKIAVFARAFVDALRDDPRLRDPLTLGGVTQQVLMAPGGCDSLLAEAKRLKLSPQGDDGCSETVRGALAAYAETAGPAGVDAKARAAAAPEVTKIAAGGN